MSNAVNTVLGKLGISTSPTKINKNSMIATARYNAKVDRRLRDILDTAAQRFPGYTVQAISGYRPGDKRQHGRRRAIDVQLVDKVTGKVLPNYQNAQSFRTYEKFAQEARRVQQEKYPGLEKSFRWGGYFSGKVKNSILGTKGKYGAVDVMHFDLAGAQIGMGGGSWAKGLTKAQRGLIPGAESYGIGHVDRANLADVSDPNRAGLQSIQDRREYERPSFAAPVGRVERSPLAPATLAGASTRTTTAPALSPQSVFGGFTRPAFDTPRNLPGMSIPKDVASPRTMATLGGINSIVGSLADAPVNRTTPKTNRLQQTIKTAAIAPAAPAAQFDERKQAIEEARFALTPPDDLMMDVPETVLPETLAQPKRVVQRVRKPLELTVRTPRRQEVAPSMPGGTLGGIRAQDRFSVGTGVQGITTAMSSGVRGATGFSRSHPGMSVTNRGGTLGTITRNDRFGTTTFRDPAGRVTGTHFDGGFGARLGNTLGGIFGGGSKSNKSSSSSGKSSGSSGSGKSGSSSGGSGARGAAGGSLGQSQRSL